MSDTDGSPLGLLLTITQAVTYPLYAPLGLLLTITHRERYGQVTAADGAHQAAASTDRAKVSAVSQDEEAG